ncbi:hypothetical protein LTR28_005038 [Elasticomyces elasticus]|nr:hypothetical protein LTR28_005038 [Elasticomyces elasticus]
MQGEGEGGDPPCSGEEGREGVVERRRGGTVEALEGWSVELADDVTSDERPPASLSVQLQLQEQEQVQNLRRVCEVGILQAIHGVTHLIQMFSSSHDLIEWWGQFRQSGTDVGQWDDVGAKE